MISVYADGGLVFDSRLEAYDLMALKTTTGLNKAGTLTLTMPPGHPAYNYFTRHKTVVTLYENGKLQWRGRALFPAEDFYNCRTITCEGERGFFRDGVMRPYLYQDSPEAIFADALEKYNAEVDEFKRFTLGRVTVTDPNDYVRLESESATTFAEFFDKLVDRCGGYITFSDDGKGGRAINWLAEIGTYSTQAIEFGENLLDFSCNGETESFATALVPYGAQNEDGTRVTIESVNGGKDWIQDNVAVVRYGVIKATNTWNDVTLPENLLKKARQWLDEHKLATPSLQLTALDLSKMDRSIDGYNVGDMVPVKSKPHGIDEYFQLMDRTTDYLTPQDSTVTLGKTVTSLTRSDVRTQRNNKAEMDAINTAQINTQLELQETEQELQDTAQALEDEIAETQETLTSKIEQTSSSILLEVSETYSTKTETMEEVRELTSKIDMTSSSILLEVSENYTLKTETAEEVLELSSKIDMTSESILLEVSENYTLKTETAEEVRQLTSKIEQTSSSILLEVSGIYATKTELSSEVTELTSKIDLQKDAILLEVSESYTLKTETEEEVRQLTSKIDLQKDSILLEVSGTYSTKTELSNEATELTSKIDLQKDAILLEVSATYSTQDDLDGEVTTLESKIQQLADSITLEVSGGLGSTASIVMTVNGETTTESLDMSYVRQAFAEDTSAVSVSAGTITFNSGTIVINSGNFTLDSSGNITARDGTFDGEFTTTSGLYKTEVNYGSLRLYYDEVLCGTINTKYYAGAGTAGISLRIEEGGSYIMFSSPNSEHATGYEVDYYLNNGWSSNATEKHNFQTSARFLDLVIFSGKTIFDEPRLYNGSFIKACDRDGIVGEELLGYIESTNRVCIGSNYCDTMLRGETVYLKNTSTTVTSDRNAKNSIEALPAAYETFIDALDPVRFKYNEGKSGRYHVGYIAQDVEAALIAAGLDSADFAGYVNVSGSGELGLQYTEFIAILHKKIKRLEAQVAALQVAQ